MVWKRFYRLTLYIILLIKSGCFLTAVFFVVKMTKEQIISKLKTIKYPGFNRDIISFGMIKEIIVEKDKVGIYLNISSQNDEKKQIVTKEIKELLSTHFNNVEINISNEQSPPIQSAVKDTNQALNNIKNIIAVASGKGGVGKSTVAVNVASALAKMGKKVGLLDLDIYGPSLPIALKIDEQPKMTENKKLIPIEKFGMKVMSFGFISGNKSPVIWRGPLVSRMTEQFFMDVEWGALDVLILDLPPGTGDIQLTLTQKIKITGAIIVTTPQDIALADVRKGADMFKKVNTPVIGVVENMSGLILNGSTNAPDSKITIDDQNIEIKSNGSFKLNIDIFDKGGGEKESKRLGVPLLARIPLSKQIMLATDCGEPLVMQETVENIGNLYMNLAKELDLIISNKSM